MEKSTNYEDRRNRPITGWGYVGYSLLFAIPVVGFLLLIIFSFDSSHLNRRGYARSYWCWLLIFVLLLAAFLAFVLTRPEVKTAIEQGSFDELPQWFEETVRESLATGTWRTKAASPRSGGEAADTGAASAYEGDELVTVEVAGRQVEVHASFKKEMDDYEAFFDEYVEFMKEPDMLAYASMMTRYAAATAGLEGIDEDELSNGDLAYYIDVTGRIDQNLLTVPN